MEKTVLRRIRIAIVVALLALVGVGVSACSSPAEPVAVSSDAVIIDVRTPAEFAAGHLEGALNLDWNGGTLTSQVSKLPTDGEYLLYCKSGNRAGQALAAMQSAGFTNVTNLGSLQEASSATGISIVK